MSSVNKAIIVGNVTADTEIKYLPSGSAVCNFDVATNESWKDKDGNKQERPEYHKIVTFGKLAEICGEYLHKGKQVYIEGRIQTDQWEDKEGNKRYTTKVIANSMQMLGAKGEVIVSEDTTPSNPDDAPPDLDDIPF